MKTSNQIYTATVAVILFKSKTLANGEHPIMLRVTKDGKRRHDSLHVSCVPSLWDEGKGLVKRNHPDKASLDAKITNLLGVYRKKLLELNQDEKEFTAKGLIEMVKKPVRKVTVYSFFEEVIEKLKQAKKIGYANSINDTLSSIKNYSCDNDLKFSGIDFNFCEGYETYLTKRGVTENTMSVYFRTLRAVYNKAVQAKAAKELDTPFKEFKVSKFDTSTRKRAIRKDEVKKIEALDLSVKGSQAFARQIFLFSYYGKGINFIDIAKLKWSNLIDNRIIYVRQKTNKLLNFKVDEPILKILENYKHINANSQEDFIFPILDRQRHITDKQIDFRIHRMNRKVNEALKTMGKDAGIETQLTTYVARHTFATVLKRSGTPIELISEAMGHGSVKITNTYLAEFENEEMDKAMESLQ